MNYICDRCGLFVGNSQLPHPCPAALAEEVKNLQELVLNDSSELPDHPKKTPIQRVNEKLIQALNKTSEEAASLRGEVQAWQARCGRLDAGKAVPASDGETYAWEYCRRVDCMLELKVPFGGGSPVCPHHGKDWRADR